MAEHACVYPQSPGRLPAAARAVTYFLVLHSFQRDVGDQPNSAHDRRRGHYVGGSGEAVGDPDSEATAGLNAAEDGPKESHALFAGDGESVLRSGGDGELGRGRRGQGGSVLDCMARFTSSYHEPDVKASKEASGRTREKVEVEEPVVRSMQERLAGIRVPPLLYAVLVEDVDEVKGLLASMASLSASEFLNRWSDVDQCTALHYACYVGNEEILLAILAHCNQHLAAAKHFPESSGTPIARRQSAQVGKRRPRMGSIQRMGATIFKSSPSTLTRRPHGQSMRQADADFISRRDSEDEDEEDDEEDEEIPDVAATRAAVHQLEDPEEVLQSALARVVRAASGTEGVRHAHFAASPLVERANSEEEASPVVRRRQEKEEEEESVLPVQSVASPDQGVVPMVLHGIAPAISPNLKASVPDCEVFAHNWVLGEASSPFLLVGHDGTNIMTQGLLFRSRDRIHKIESVFYSRLGVHMPLHALAEMHGMSKAGGEEEPEVRPDRLGTPGYLSLYYEVTLKTSGMFQIGWASNSSRPSAIVGDGVGDTSDSWAYDGCRRRRWHDAIPGPLTCGNPTRWSAGDVVGCLLQVPERITEATSASGARLEFYLNGDLQHVDNHILPYEYDHVVKKNVRDGQPQPDWQLFPALSLENLQECHVNVGQEPFAFRPAVPGLLGVGSVPILDNKVLCALDYYPPMQSTPLAWALSRQNTRAVAALLQCDLELAGASVLTGWSAFEMAAFYKHSSGLRMLMDEAIKNLPRQPRPLRRQRRPTATKSVRAALHTRRRVRRNESAADAREEKLKASLNRALVIAASRGSLACVILLLRPPMPSLAADVNHKEGGWAALHCAALNGHSKVVSYLLDNASADVQMPNMHGSTAIHLAAFGGHESVLRVLLRHIYECLTPGEQSALTASGARRDAEAAKMVMTTVVDAKDGAKVTAVTLALKRNALGCVRLLLDENPVKLSLDRLRTTGSAASSAAATALGILGSSASPNVSSLQIMMGVAFECGDRDTLAYLMDVFDIDLPALLTYDCLSLAPNERLLRDVLALFEAEDQQGGVGQGEEENSLVRSLVQYQKAREYCMLDVAILYLCDGSSRLLIEHGADVNSCVVFTPLVCSVLSGSSDVAEMLLRSGADVAGLDVHQSTALTRAVHQGKPHLLPLLLAWGAGEAEANRERDFYPPAMHYALRATRQHHNCLAILAEYCPQQINNNTREHRTPLYKATKNSATEAAIFLLEHNADPNLCNLRSGGSPLHHAVHRGNLKLVTVLLDANAIADAPDVGGVTPLHYSTLPRAGLLATVKSIVDALRSQLSASSGRSLADALNSASSNGKRTAAHWLCTNLAATSKDRKAALKLLIANGADITLKDSDGSSPWQWACTYHNTPLAHLLYDLTEETREEEKRLHVPALGGEVIAVGSQAEILPSWFSSAEEFVHQYPPLDPRLVAVRMRKAASDVCFTSPPRLIRALSRQRVVQVACGDGHYGARTADGAVFLWGEGACGQLGLGYQRFQRIPMKIDAERFGGEPVRHLACGSGHTVVVTRRGIVYAFGCGSSGQLGCGDWNDQVFPRIVPQLGKKGVVKVAAGSTFSAAVTKDTSVYYWGSMVGSDEAKINLPKLIGELREVNVVDIAAGRDHLLAVDTQGVLYAGGRFSSGQLGQGESANGHMQAVPGLAGVMHAAGGAAHSAAATWDGKVFAWGSNLQGQLGLSSELRKVEVPSAVPVLGSAVAVACSVRASAVCTADGRLMVASQPPSGVACGRGVTMGVVPPLAAADAGEGDEAEAVTEEEEEEDGEEGVGDVLEETNPAVGQGSDEAVEEDVEGEAGVEESAELGGDGDSAAMGVGGDTAIQGAASGGETAVSGLVEVSQDTLPSLPLTAVVQVPGQEEEELVPERETSLVRESFVLPGVDVRDSSDSDGYDDEDEDESDSGDDRQPAQRLTPPSVASPPLEEREEAATETLLHTVLEESSFSVAMGTDVLLALVDISLDRRHTRKMFLGSEEYSDTVLRFSDGLSLPCHSVILAARSSVLRDLFLGKETNQTYVTMGERGVVDVADERARVEPLITWLYTDSYPEAVEEGDKRLGDVAERLGVDLQRPLLADLAAAYADLQAMADVRLRACDKEVPLAAHKVLLAARSEYFHAMFHHAMREEEAAVVDMPSMAHSVLAAVLQYVYSGTFEYSGGNILGLLAAADQLNLLEMKCDVEAAIMEAVDASNVVALHGLALQHGAFSLKLHCERFIEKLCRDSLTEEMEVPQGGSDEFERQVALLRKLAKIRDSCQP